MSDYTHFTNLAFGNLFARKDSGQEVQVMDSNGNFTVTGLSSTGNISVKNVTATGTIAATGTVTGSNLSGTNTGDQTTITGNAGTATALQTARSINGTSFNGTADITVTAAAGTLTGATLASNVLASSLTSVGTLASLTVTNPIAGSVTGTAASVTGVTTIAHGGTNSSATLSNNRIIQSTGGKIQEAAAITANRVVVSDSNGIPTQATTTTTQLANNLGTATAKSADYTVTDTDSIRTVLMTTSSTNRTVTLPAVANNTDRIITFKKVDSGTGKCTISGTIDGTANFDLVDQDDWVSIQSDGTNWNLIGKGIGTRTISRVKDEVGAGHGSTNTKVRRIETNVTNTGNAITRATSATNGNSYTVNQTGLYCIVYSDAYNSNATTLGISVNSAQLTTSIDAITSANRLAVSESGATSLFGSCAVTLKLTSGDVIRPQTDGNPNSTSVKVAFQIQKVGI